MPEQELERQANRYVWTVAICLILVFGLAVWDWVAQQQKDRPAANPEPAAVSEPQLADWLLEKMDRGEPEAELPYSDFAGPDPMIEDTYLRQDIPLSWDLQADLYGACLEFGVDYALALAVVETESQYQNLIGDGGDSIGYMQIQPKWHKARMKALGVDDLADPEGNFRVGCSLLADLLEGNTLEDALSLYNTGHGGSTDYSRAVMKQMENQEKEAAK